MEIFFFRIRLWECVYKQINSLRYFGQKKGGRAMEWNGKRNGKVKIFLTGVIMG